MARASKTIYSPFMENLRKHRAVAGYNAMQFAEKVGVPYPTYLGYESKGAQPPFDVLIRIASALHVTVDELLGYQLDELGNAFHLCQLCGFPATKQANGEIFVKFPHLNFSTGEWDIAKYVNEFDFQKRIQAAINRAESRKMELVQGEIYAELDIRANTAVFLTEKDLAPPAKPKRKKAARAKGENGKAKKE